MNDICEEETEVCSLFDTIRNQTCKIDRRGCILSFIFKFKLYLC